MTHYPPLDSGRDRIGEILERLGAIEAKLNQAIDERDNAIDSLAEAEGRIADLEEQGRKDHFEIANLRDQASRDAIEITRLREEVGGIDEFGELLAQTIDLLVGQSDCFGHVIAVVLRILESADFAALSDVGADGTVRP